MASIKRSAFALLLITGCIFWSWHRQTGLSTVEGNDAAPAAVSAMPIEAVVKPAQKTVAVDPTERPRPIRVRVVAPTVADLREEAKRNVHVTPPSLLNFAASIGSRMKEAKNSKAAAADFLKELAVCVHPAHLEESPIQSRALCLVTARELETQWPDLHDQVDSIVKSAEPETIALASSLDHLGN